MYIRHFARSSVEFLSKRHLAFCSYKYRHFDQMSTVSACLTLGYIPEKSGIERWNGAFCFQSELRKQELIKTLEIMTLIRVIGRIRGIFYH
jgi:hypothetical protein